jgi:hypothetical protein
VPPGPDATSYTLPNAPNSATANAALEKLLKQLDAPTSLDFADSSLEEALLYVKDLHGINVVVDQEAFRPKAAGDKGLATKGVTLKLENVPLGAALQAIEDTNRTVTLVVREYGILVVPREFNVADDAVPLGSFWKTRGAFFGLGSATTRVPYLPAPPVPYGHPQDDSRRSPKKSTPATPLTAPSTVPPAVGAPRPSQPTPTNIPPRTPLSLPIPADPPSRR